MSHPIVHGTVEQPFEAVAEVFRAHFRDGREDGAACAVFVNGRRALDLWGGVADRDTGRPWIEDTPVLLYSATKGLAATALHRAAQQGALDFDAPVARYWPEFAAAGKADCTVAQALSHQAGLCLFEPFAFADLFRWDESCARLAAQAPLWPPGERLAYHALTFGWLAGELVRRSTGRSLGDVVAETAALLGNQGELLLGVPDEALDRLGVCRPAHAADSDRVAAGNDGAAGRDSFADALHDPASLTARVFRPVLRGLATRGADRRRWWQCGHPAFGAAGTARALAHWYFHCGVRGATGRSRVKLFSPATLACMARPVVTGFDEVARGEATYGLGFLFAVGGEPLAPSGAAFGFVGLGGTVAFADPVHELAFAYVTNRLGRGVGLGPRARALIATVYDALPRGTR